MTAANSEVDFVNRASPKTGSGTFERLVDVSPLIARASQPVRLNSWGPHVYPPVNVRNLRSQSMPMIGRRADWRCHIGLGNRSQAAEQNIPPLHFLQLTAGAS